MPSLVPPEGVDAARIAAIAAGECLTRQLINTPANLMGPAELQAAAEALAVEHGASIEVIDGDTLLERNFPMIHAVGRASDRSPRLIDIRWGGSGPSLTLVGKGIVFDTGGLDLKPSSSMALMKKDMGGAATVLGLAHMIMASVLPVRLRVLLPVAENAVAGSAFRPGDVLTSRAGLTVEINNTDAEGRLVLADALAYGGEESPDLMVSMATLTGAARVAVGPDLAPFYTGSDSLAAALSAVIAACPGSGVGPCRRSAAWAAAFWSAASATPIPCMATPSRALFIMVNIAAMPLCGAPTSQPVAPSNCSTAVGEPCSPSLCSRLTVSTAFGASGRPSAPGRSFGTRNRLIPFVPGAASGSRASTRWQMFSAMA